ncbi:MAG: hypothetical protein K0R54_5018 [Clostridiaceae bacterium]|jgi:hypothetical protein|nr:hypothetical protein [Clostridiaceae bacterium]
MNWNGIIIGLGVFFIIGIMHPVVIKSEYYIGKHIWPLYLIGGIICVGLSVVIDNVILSILTAVLGFTLFWSIHELYEQEQRVKKGWFPANPNKKRKHQ